MILESLVIGIVASLIGLALGLLLAEGIQALFGTFGFELPTAERVFALRTVIVSMLVGVVVTLARGPLPGDPRDASTADRRGTRGSGAPSLAALAFRSWIAALVVVGALLLLGRAMFTDDLGTADRLLSIAAGVLLLFVGIAMLSSRLVRPIAALVGLPAPGSGARPGSSRAGTRCATPVGRRRRLPR